MTHVTAPVIIKTLPSGGMTYPGNDLSYRTQRQPTRRTVPHVRDETLGHHQGRRPRPWQEMRVVADNEQKLLRRLRVAKTLVRLRCGLVPEGSVDSWGAPRIVGWVEERFIATMTHLGPVDAEWVGELGRPGIRQGQRWVCPGAPGRREASRLDPAYPASAAAEDSMLTQHWHALRSSYTSAAAQTVAKHPFPGRARVWTCQTPSRGREAGRLPAKSNPSGFEAGLVT